ncbi:heavy metal-associated isoprenylated plant protein 28 [Andrographis paniculata]|uniref:heavy metal-associated isoprenylated plant protein 28 n=1 Tax=Andrographis paniculata TaxID=175694 RepID=UPI0021E860A4|nr:heavy metal-associated isoprenylated plant protein 28 [Andrographis paniculata]
MMVPLYSYGCRKKIQKALSHLKGIYSVNVKFPQQKVTVWGICDKHDVLSIVKKERKGARFWNPEIDDQMAIDGQDRSPSHSAPPSPSNGGGADSTRRRGYLTDVIKKQGSALRLNLSLIKIKSLNWHKSVLDKAFSRSFSF